MSDLTLQLLGTFSAVYKQTTIQKFRTGKAQALLVYLAVEKGQPHRREQLIDLLWPGLTLKSARTNLRQVLYQLRTAFPEVAARSGGNPVPLFVSDYRTIQFNPAAAVMVDALEFEQQLAAVRHHHHSDITTCADCLASLEATVASYSGQFLNGFHLADSSAYEEWLMLQREAYQRRYLDALGSLGRIHLANGCFSSAETIARQQLAIDDLRESAYRQLFEALARNGQRGEAMVQFEHMQALLQRELGMSPTHKTVQLTDAIANDTLANGARVRLPARGYELLEQVGEGAFGTVHRAYQSVVGREVAVKVIRPELANRPNFIRRFEIEAQTVAQLEHPHIVPLYDYWREPDGAFLVMRYLRGGNVATAIAQRGAWAEKDVLQLVSQIGPALATAHARDVIHRDLKPANILLDGDGNAYLTDFGIAQMGAVATPLLTPSPLYSSPEQLRGEPATACSDIYTFGLLVYELLTGKQPYANHTLPALGGHVDAVLQKATAPNPGDRFLDAVDFVRELHLALAGSRLLLAPALAVQIEGNPFRGLRAFQETDAELFFGRNALIDQLLTHLSPAGTDGSSTPQNRFLAVVGPSGSGKSSVVKAGLLPKLRSGAVDGSENWFITEMVPGTHPLEEVEAALLRAAVDPPASLIEPLQKDERGLVRTLKRILPTQDGQLLLVIDQFEELFTLTSAAKRQQFLSNLLVALNAPRSQLRVIITLRADFYDKPLQVSGLAQRIQAHNVVVPPLSAVELEQAITQPAHLAGVRFEDGLIVRIIDDVRDQPGILPLLQFALTELFERRAGDVIMLSDYDALGGVTGVLGKQAEIIYNSFSVENQQLTRQLFLRLITLGAGVDDTRRRVPESELSTIANDDRALFSILSAFGNSRLISFDRNPATREPTVEVAHEALMRKWPRLRKWLDESRADVRQQRLLGAEALAWQRSMRDSAYLLRGSRLQQFDEWVSGTTLALTTDEHEYLQASRVVRDSEREQAAIHLARERQLERRSRRILQVLLAVFGVAAVIAAGLTLFAFHQRDNVQRISLAAQAQMALERGDDMVVPALLAIRSLTYAYSPEADEALLGALDRGFTRQFVGHSDSLASIVFSPDGQYVLTGANDATARLWDAQTGVELRQFVGHGELVTQAVFMPGGKRVVTSSADRTVRLWDVATGAELARLPEHSSTVWALAVSPDGRTIATADESGSFWLWDAQTRRLLGAFAGHDDVILSVAFAPDGEQVATGGVDRTVRLWDVGTGQTARLIEGHAAAVNSVAFSPDGQHLLTAGSDNVAALWDVATGQRIQTYLGHSNVVRTASFAPGGQQMVTGSYDGTVRIWDVVGGQEVDLFVRQVGRVTAATFSPDGAFILSASTDPVGRMWQVEVDSEPRTFAMPFYTTHGSDPVMVLFSADSQQIIIGGSNGVVTQRDVNSGQIALQRRFDTEGLITAMAYSADHSRALVADAEGTVSLWDVGTSTLLRTASTHSAAIWAAAFAPDGSIVLTGSEDNTACLWDARSGSEIRRFIGHVAPVRAVAFSPDGGTILTGSEDGTAWLWDAATGLERWRLEGHGGAVQAVAFSPDGSTVMTGSDDKTARLWSTESGELTAEFVGHAEAIRAVAFLPGQNQVATGSNDGTARLWDVDSGAIVRQFSGHTGPIRLLHFSDAGDLLLTVENPAVRMWRTALPDVIAAACAQLPRDFTQAEREIYGIISNQPTCSEG